MGKNMYRERMKAFILRRKLNAFGLLLITLLSVLVTIFCAIRGFARTNILAICSALLIALCFLQAFRMRKSFRRLPSFRGLRKKRKTNKDEAKNG